jgi:hypothetical protein
MSRVLSLPSPLAAIPADDTVVVRRAVAADAADLERLRLLDSAPRAPRGTVLVAEADCVVQAAHAVEDGLTLADPFRATAALTALLRARASLLRGPAPARTRTPLRLRRRRVAPAPLR